MEEILGSAPRGMSGNFALPRCEGASTTKHAPLHRRWRRFQAVARRFDSDLLSLQRTPMKKQGKPPAGRRNPPPLKVDEQHLLQLLVSEAQRRGDTLTNLAKALGVTYRRLAQWRRADARVESAGRPVFERAAQYLGWPTLFVLLHADVVRLTDIAWPGRVSLADHLAREIERMRQHPRIGPLVPSVLEKATPAIRFFALFLFTELERATQIDESRVDWLEELRRVSQTHLKETGVAPPSKPRTARKKVN